MNIVQQFHIPHQPSILKYIAIALAFFLVAIGIQPPTYGQSTGIGNQAFEKLQKDYHSGNISQIEYIELISSQMRSLLAEGAYIETSEMIDLLSLYKDIAWSKEEYFKPRVNYFVYFLNNARMFEKNGASIYYAEKIAQEYKKNGKEHSLMEPLQKCYIYMEQKRYDKIISVYQQEQEYIQNLPTLLENGAVDIATALDAIYILSPTVTAYIKTTDTTSIYQTAELANQIGNVLKNKYPIHKQMMLYNDFFMLEIAYAVANFENDYHKAGTNLKDVEALKAIYSDENTTFIDFNSTRWHIEHYLTLGNQDSVKAYISKFEAMPTFGKDQFAKKAEYKSKLALMQGNLREAYRLLSESLEGERDVQDKLMEEIDELLYAYTEAEHNREELQKAEAIKRQRTTWLLVISFVAIVVVAGIYRTMIRRSRKAKDQIETLNNMANMQITSMEEVKAAAVREEQKRLGRDLHDNLSSTLAGVRHRVDVLTRTESTPPAISEQLGQISHYIEQAYNISRGKSHEWYQDGITQEEASFEYRIRQLLDSVLTDELYDKEVQIDQGVLNNVSIETRIEFLRIIQEAVTNTIKHAKARCFSVSMHRQDNHLVLTIHDDGKGMFVGKHNKAYSGIGISSMRDRVQHLHGTLAINASAKGTEIMVNIPVQEGED